MKNQKGVTIISMVIVIVIIILLASYSILTSRDVVTEVNVQTYFQEIKLVNDNVKGLSLDKKYFKDTFEPFKIENINEYNARVGNNLRPDRQYYLIGYGEESLTEVMRQTLNETLDVRNVENSYIISFVDMGKVEVFLVDGVRIGDNYYYTYEEIHNAYSNVTKK